MYYKDQNTGKLTLLSAAVDGGFVAWTTYTNAIGDNDTFGLVDYPRGFRMITGDPFRVTPPTNQVRSEKGLGDRHYRLTVT
jgi:hypothetical protein